MAKEQPCTIADGSITFENFRPAAEEAAVRDEEAAQFTRFGGSGPGFMSL